VTTLRRALDAPDAPLRGGAGTRTTVLRGASSPPGGPLSALIAEQAAATPDAVALAVAAAPGGAAMPGTVSYAELELRANRLAHHLRTLGVAAETTVGLCLPRGVDMVIAMLAVWRAGGAYLPVNPSQLSKRSHAVLRDAGVSVVIAEDADALRADGRVVVTTDGLDQALAGLPATAPQPVTSGAAYVLYTSGSTGAPKGVVVTHEAIANYVRWVIRDHGLGPGDRVLQKTPLVFDAAGWEVFGPLASGGTVVLAPPGAERDPDGLVRLLGAERITVLQVVPSLLRLLVEAPGWSDCGALRMLLSAGEPLRAELCARLRTLTTAEIRNTYGPTECAIDSTGATYDPGQASGPVPIGVPIDNAHVAVLDAAGDLALEGEPGELYIGGRGVGRGYLGRPGATAERFVPDPFGPPGSRLYRTGDLVRLRPDGALDFLGRIDDQIKVNGVRIEPAEIEAALLTHPSVTAAVVMAVDSAAGAAGEARRLVAYLQCADQPDLGQLRRFLRQRLPDYLVPAGFVWLPAFPLTPSGKVDRRALPPVDAAAHAPFVAPRGHAEQEIAAVWADLLRVDSVGATDDFFALGGHSLLLTRLAVRLRDRFDTEVAIRDLLTATTVAAQAQLVAERRRSEPIPRVARPGPLPLSSGQRRLWFLDRLDPGSAQYVLPHVVRLRGPVDEAALRRALTGVVRRNEILRTRYQVVDGEPVQVVDDSAEVPLTVVPARAAELAGLVGAELARPFDLERGPVLRATLLRVADDDAVLVLAIHHIACDGWSVEILTGQLWAGYAAGGRLPGDEPEIQYADFAAWQRQRLDAPEITRELEYWRDRLAGAAPTELLTDHPRPPARSGQGAMRGFTVPAELAGRVLRLGRAEGATAFMTMLAAFDALLARYTGGEDVTVGTAVAGRTHPSAEQVVGFFVNTLVLRTDLAGEPSFRELVRRVRADCLGAYAHQELPFERLVEVLQPDRDLSRNPMFQLMFEMAAEPVAVDGGDVLAEPYAGDVPWHTAKFDLTLTLSPRADGTLHGLVEYATELFEQGTVDAFTDHYVRLLAAVADAPDAPVTRLSMTDGAEASSADGFGGPSPERDELAADPGERAAERSMAAAVVRRAEIDGGAVAVAADDQTLTYAELLGWADALAAELRGGGVAAEVPVVLCLRRGMELVVAWLAVLRAGGVCVPVDPDHPAERLTQLVADAGAEVVLTAADVAAHRASARRATEGAVEGVAAAEAADDTHPEQIAYMIYTSGSTGRPKGVTVTHRAYLHHCRVMVTRYGIHRGDRVALLSSPLFDVAMDQMATALMAGATVVVADSELTSPDRLCDWLHDERVTHLQITPAHYRELMSALDPGDERLSRLRVMDVGADVVRYSDAQRWYAAGMPGRFLCSYGPTECTVTSTLHPVDEREAGRHRPERTVPIGRPVPATRAYILDRWLNPVPPGIAGELYLGGVRLARGYHDRPALTAERFVPDPFGESPGERLYRTGDLVRTRPDGAIEFLGRIDGQVKIRGFRIEVGEVEAMLTAHPGVQAVTVTAYRGGGEPELAAYLVPHGELDLPALRAHVADRLPTYLIPTYWTVLPALPLTASGKVDRRALPEPTRLRRGYRPPVTPAQSRIADIWAELLGLDKVGLDDEFFELGGHSLLTTQVRGLVREAFGVDVPLRRLFAATTVEALAAAVEEEVVSAVGGLSDEEVEAMLSPAEGEPR
jgi:amino acid adenylation domain-containing protein